MTSQSLEKLLTTDEWKDWYDSDGPGDQLL